MASSEKPLKGILKKPAAGAPSPPQPAALSEDEKAAEARRIAVQHATIIQQQKDLESQVFDAINELLDFPLAAQDDDDNSNSNATTHTAASPAPSDAARFKALIRVFQPADFDDLVEERNIAGRCGYALCARPRRRLRGAGEFKLTNIGRKDFSIVRTADLEKWCSDDCTRRALYVRIQLDETPAQQRAGNPNFRIELFGEDDGGKDTEGAAASGLAADVARLQLEDDERKASDASALALERGDASPSGPIGPGRSFDIAIRERRPSEAGSDELREAVPPGAEPDESHLLVEGHKVRLGNSQGGEAGTSKS